MQYSQSEEYVQNIVLEIRSETESFPIKSITYLEDGIRLVLKAPQQADNSNQRQRLPYNDQQQQIFANPKEKQTKLTLSVKSLNHEANYSQIIKPAPVYSIGTQTSAFANPKVLVNNSKIVPTSNLVEESQLLMNVWKSSKSNEIQNLQTLQSSRQDSKQENKTLSEIMQTFSEQSPIGKVGSPFTYKKIFDLQQDQDRAKQRSQQNVYNLVSPKSDPLLQNKNHIEESKGAKTQKKNASVAKSLTKRNLNRNFSKSSVTLANMKTQKSTQIKDNDKSESLSDIIEARSFSDSQNFEEVSQDYKNEGSDDSNEADEEMTIDHDEEIKEQIGYADQSENSILYVQEASFLPQPYSLVQKPHYEDFKQQSTKRPSNPHMISRCSKKVIKKCNPKHTLPRKNHNSIHEEQLGLKEEKCKKATGGRNSKYQCKFCKKKFRQCAALGGHISKAHPGQSQAYNHKKRVREERELERMLHKDAMDYYFQTYNGRGKDSQTLNRNTIKRIKKMLVNNKNDYKQLRSKFLGKSQANSQDFDKSEDDDDMLESQHDDLLDEQMQSIDEKSEDKLDSENEEIHLSEASKGNDSQSCKEE